MMITFLEIVLFSKRTSNRSQLDKKKTFTNDEQNLIVQVTNNNRSGKWKSE